MDAHAGRLRIEDIRCSLKTQRIGRRIHYFPSTSSANDEAWKCLEESQREGGVDCDGLVVLTEFQSAGRGRFGRAWDSPRGASLLCSVALLDREERLRGCDLGLIAAVAVCDAVLSCTDVLTSIKWPNDVLVSGRKLGGILVESRRIGGGLRGYVLGIGVNCLQQTGHWSGHLAHRATSLELETLGGVDRTTLTAALIAELDRWLGEPLRWTYPDLRTAWMRWAEPLGQRVHLRHDGRVFNGTILDLDPSAALLVQLDEGGLRAFDAADTTLLPESTAGSCFVGALPTD